MKDIIHLYLNQQVQVRKKNDNKRRDYLIGRICEVTRGSNHGDWIKVWFDDCYTVTNDTWDESTSNSHCYFIGHDEIKLVLRRLSDMSEDDSLKIFGTNSKHLFYQKEEERNPAGLFLFTPDEYKKLCEESFDLFNLIDSGLAIDQKTINQ